MRPARKPRETTKCRNEDMERGTKRPKWPTAYLEKHALKQSSLITGITKYTQVQTKTILVNAVAMKDKR